MSTAAERKEQLAAAHTERLRREAEELALDELALEELALEELELQRIEELEREEER